MLQQSSALHITEITLIPVVLLHKTNRRKSPVAAKKLPKLVVSNKFI
jgi:hypothetical protein